MRLKDEYAGRRGQCPKCQAPIGVPRPAPVEAANSSPSGTANPIGANESARPTGKAQASGAAVSSQSQNIEFRCDGCGKKIRAPAAAAGRAVACPGCGNKLRVPENPPSTASPVTAASTPELPISTAASHPFDELSDSLLGDEATAPSGFAANTSPALAKARGKNPLVLYASIGAGLLVVVVLLVAVLFWSGSGSASPGNRPMVATMPPTANSTAPPAIAPPAAMPPVAAPPVVHSPAENAATNPPDVQPPPDSTVATPMTSATTTPDGPSSPEDVRAYMETVDRVLEAQADVIATLQKITDAASARQQAAHWADRMAEVATLAEHRPKRVRLSGADAERDHANEQKMNQLLPTYEAAISHIRQVPDALPMLRAALDARLSTEKDEAVAKRLRSHGGYVYDLEAIDRLTLLQQTLETTQKMLDAERQIVDVASAKRLSPEAVRSMAEQARLVDQQPHVKISATKDEVAKCESLATRINALVQAHNAEVQRITAIPEVGDVFRAAIDAEAARDPNGPLATQQRAAKAAAATRPDAAQQNPNSDPRGEEFVTLVERSIATAEDLMAVARTIKDVTSAKKHAATWARLTADSMDLDEEQNQLAGLQLTGALAERYQAAQRRDARQAKDAQAEIARLQQSVGVMPILKEALDKELAARKAKAAAAN